MTISLTSYHYTWMTHISACENIRFASFGSSFSFPSSWFSYIPGIPASPWARIHRTVTVLTEVRSVVQFRVTTCHSMGITRYIWQQQQSTVTTPQWTEGVSLHKWPKELLRGFWWAGPYCGECRTWYCLCGYLHTAWECFSMRRDVDIVVGFGPNDLQSFLIVESPLWIAHGGKCIGCDEKFDLD